MKNPLLNYDWGSTTLIPEVFGQMPDGKPQAEVWMGAHPKAPSEILWENRWIPLDQALQTKLTSLNKDLPFLLKILAAKDPLSIQVHPNKIQAQQGFKRENQQQIPLDDPRRSYKDPRAKPELIVAVKNGFTALHGFRPPQEIKALGQKILPSELLTALEGEEKGQNFVLKSFLEKFFQLRAATDPKFLAEKIKTIRPKNKSEQWVQHLHQLYPNDLAVFAPLFLNLIELSAGEALFLPAGILHAYLKGIGIELMTNSDNVIRSGLTPKHIDIPELLKIASFEVSSDPITSKTTSFGQKFSPPANFSLDIITFPEKTHTSDGFEILLNLHQKNATISQPGKPAITLAPGHSLFVLPKTSYQIKRSSHLYRATTA